MGIPETNKRPENVPPELEAAELAWWDKYAVLEQKFAWVQTPQIQNILRGDYVREIISKCPPSGRIIELGCGVGWLCCALAEHGAGEVWGTDFSEKQIELAKQEARSRGVSEKVNFATANNADQFKQLGLFDVVIVHAFLHHLTGQQLKECIASIPKYLTPGGMLLVFEPVHQNKPRPYGLLPRIMQKLGGLAKKLRRYSPEEIHWRKLFSERHVGKEPHGPSPKEMPFEPESLDRFLFPYFEIESKKVFLASAHLVMQEWLLRAVSAPRSTRILLPFVARIASALDKRMIIQGAPEGAWLFTMFVCRPKNF